VPRIYYGENEAKLICIGLLRAVGGDHDRLGLRRDAKVLGRCSTFDLAIESGGVPIVNYRIACAGPAWFDDTVVILSFY
jgi:hypothetical protein